MEQNNYIVKHYEAKDFDLLNSWWVAHDGQPRNQNILPACGVICERNGEPVTALFLHMDNSCGMSMIEHAVSRPKLSLKIAMEGFRHCVSVLKKIAATHGYHTMAAFVHPAIARVLEGQGFSKAETGLIQMLVHIELEVRHG